MRAHHFPLVTLNAAALAILAACNPAPDVHTYAVEVVTCASNGRECDADRPSVWLSRDDCEAAAEMYAVVVPDADSVACVDLSYGQEG